MEGKILYQIDEDNLSDFAKIVAGLIKDDLKHEPEAYLTPVQLGEVLPALSRYKIANQIREGKFGKKIGPKGNLVATIKQVKAYNKI